MVFFSHAQKQRYILYNISFDTQLMSNIYQLSLFLCFAMIAQSSMNYKRERTLHMELLNLLCLNQY